MGPSGLGWVTDVDLIAEIASIGIIFLLFLLGLDMQPQALSRVLRQVTHITLISSLLFALAGYGVGYLFGFSPTENLIIGASMMFTGLGYFMLGLIPWTWMVIFPIIFAHIAGGANWVLSTVQLQRRAIDQYRGRVFATEWLLVMGVEALSILLASLVLEMGLISLRSTVLGFAMASTIIGLFWAIRAIPAEKSDYREGKVPEA